jgi:hypothetical protein
METLRVKADSADKIIAEAEAQGKDTNNPDVMKELGKEINALGTPIHRSEAVMTAISATLHMIFYYGIAIGIWGLAFRKISLFIFIGVGVGFLISLLSVASVVAYSRTKQKIQDMMFGAGAIWGGIAMMIGIAGVIAFIIRLIFFK